MQTLAAALATLLDGHVSRSSVKLVCRSTTTPISDPLVSTRVDITPQYILSSPLTIILFQAAIKASWPERLDMSSLPLLQRSRVELCIGHNVG
jgi:hypothetical protein